MKNIPQIAKETGLNTDTIRKICLREKINPALKISSKKFFFDEYQEKIILEILYFEGRFNTLTFESKMNYGL